jgi:hypothetical protein
MPNDLRSEIEQKVRELMSRDARESAIVDLILEHRAQEAEMIGEKSRFLATAVGCENRARQLRAAKREG